MRYSEDGLYPALEAALKKATEPVDAQAFFDMPSIREHAPSANRVSDYLGNMWRKGLVTRVPSSNPTSRSKWAYQWKGTKSKTLLGNIPHEAPISYEPRILADRPSMVITEEGSLITITYPNLVIQLRYKG